MSDRSSARIFIIILILSAYPLPDFAQGTSGETPPLATQPETIGAQKTLIALFNFSDVPNQPFTLDSVRDMILTASSSTNNFLKENSYQKTWLEADFVDWTTIPGISTSVCSGST
jgi:hypothetical protein